MGFTLAILLGLVMAAIPGSFLLFPRSRFPLVLVVIALAGVVAFCGFGFLASYEFTEPEERWPWQAGYAAVGVAGLVGIRWIVRRWRQDGFRR
ncbi:hypothetical protein LBMAG56_18170 [Verrucomicrobiota bacterium]|nr:hypothetical protein LBMAG56_18170 [Verrucomicrobiota bacterium]